MATASIATNTLRKSSARTIMRVPVRPRLTMNSFREAFAAAGLFGLLSTLMFFTPLWAPQAIFGRPEPIPQRRSGSMLSAFTVADGLILVSMLAAGNCLVSLLRSEMTLGALISFALGINLLTGLMWIQCLRFMREYGILHRESRILMQAVLYPMSVVVVSEMLACGMMLLSALDLVEGGFESGIRRYVQHPLTVTAASLLGLSTVTVLALRWLFKRFVLPREREALCANMLADTGQSTPDSALSSNV